MAEDLIEELNEKVGHSYHVERQLGAGGMATVWLAQDVRHRRKVALKVLHREVSAVLGRDRFLREIEITAALQHPHILPLFDSGSIDWILYYVMPYVEGESLRQRLSHEGALSIEDGVRILRDLAEALSHAHAHGVVHRDIKPENIMLRDRHALIADFGIARAVSDAAGKDSFTSAGLALGTPAYMSPEQAVADKTIDQRSDIYAFGVVAYEILAGRLPFTADTGRGILVAHLTSHAPSLSAARPDVPPGLDALVAKCLEKDPDDRWQSADEIVAELERIGADARDGHERHRRSGSYAYAAVAASALIVASAGLFWWSRRESPSFTVERVVPLTKSDGLELDPALSPDGKTVAYVAGAPGRMRIYLRQVEGGRTIPLTDSSVTPNQRWPQWSPDGSHILYQSGVNEPRAASGIPNPGGTLYIVPSLGGTPRRLLDSSPAGAAFGGSWSPDGRQVAFVRKDTVYVMPSAGGELSAIDVSANAFGPRWSPDGKFIAYASGNPRFVFGTTHLANSAPAAIRIVRLSDKRSSIVVPDSSLNVSPVWSIDGRKLLFVSDRDGRRDVYSLAIDRDGRAKGVAQRITTGIDAHTIDLSNDGTHLVYSAYTPAAHLWRVPIPAAGSVSAYGGKQLTFDRESIEGIALSDDNRWVAFDSDRSGNFDIWKVQSEGGTPVQLTTNPAGDYVQSWSPSSDKIVFHSFRTGNRDVFVMNADGGGEQRVTSSPASESNPAWCGQNSIVVQTSTPQNDETLYLWTRANHRASWSMRRRLTATHGTDPACSRDGEWLAYLSDGALRVMSMTTFESRILVPPHDPATNPEPAMPGFGPDARSVYYMAYDSERVGSIWSVERTGGTPRLLVKFDDPTRVSLRRDFATDGASLYFAIAQPQSDVYLMELR